MCLHFSWLPKLPYLVEVLDFFYIIYHNYFWLHLIFGHCLEQIRVVCVPQVSIFVTLQEECEDQVENPSQEAVFVEKSGDDLVLHFKCPCGDGYEILLSGNNCYYKLTNFRNCWDTKSLISKIFWWFVSKLIAYVVIISDRVLTVQNIRHASALL